ncbi:MAG: threonine ammonia-lyase [Bdellovibrionaceae bacterium]|nr:threonine ammonia-lyase [Pseudobdellovibrionaceae bacterium]
MKVSLTDIEKARKVLNEISKKTEMDISVSASKLLGRDIFFKFENTQRTGSFKIRGAYNKMMNLTSDEKKRGVVASSAGNHAQGVALSATLAGVKSTIVMPENAPLTKVNATIGYGANVILKGEIYDDAYEHARALEKEHGYVFVHPYEDAHIIAGQGTIGLEIHEEVSDLDSVVIPIGGGGLISGISTVLKALNPKIKIIGVQSDQASGMSQLFHKQSLDTQKKRISTIADGIAIKTPSKIIYDNFISKNVDEVVTVSDDELAEAMVFLLERAKTLCEGSGAAAMAAAMNRNLKLGKKSCIILSGGNVDLNVIAKIIDKGQLKRGRLIELSVVVDDLPGSLNRLTRAIAEQKANILEVHHDRISQGLFLRETRVDFVLETSSPEHIEKIKQALIKAGGKIL